MLDKQTPPDAGSLLRTAARDKDFGFSITASWADVQRKAKRIRSEGGVTIVVASGDGIGGQVTGDHGTYEAILVYAPGSRKVVDYHCGCKWAAFAWDRSPAFKRFEGRKCSHALALQFEAQSQGMFGKEVSESEPPRRVPTIVSYDPDTGQNILARPYEGSLVAAMVAQLRAADEDPAEIVGGLVRAGMAHTAAVALFKSAEDEEGHEHRCPHCGGFIGLGALEAHKCPHCGAPLGGEAHHEGSAHDALDNLDFPEDAHRLLGQHNIIGHTRASYAPDAGDGEIDWDEMPSETRHLSPHEELHTSQPFLNGNKVRHYINGGQPDFPHQPWTVQHEGKTWIGEGHHRILADRMGAQQGLTVKHFDLDKDAPTMYHEGTLSPESVAQGVMDEYNRLRAEAAEEKSKGPSVSGVALKAHDTGRVLMIQRGLEDEKDPARGRWEFPGGHHEDGDLTSLHAGIREFQEEVGQEFPANGAVKHTWTSPNGIYQGHVVVIPSEKDLSMKDGRVTVNPDDPKGDNHEQAAWWHPDDARKNPALREELKTGTPWKEIAKASLDNGKTAAAWDPISNTNPQPGRGTSQPEHSDTTNPASTGWAASEDPANWDNLNANPTPLTPSLGYDGALHSQPEPALPTTYGDDAPTEYHPEITPADLDPVPDNPPQTPDLVPDQDGSISLLQGGSVTPNTFHSSLAPEAPGDRLAAIVAAFQKSAAAQELMAAPEGDDDIVQAAKAHLAKSKTALKSFDFVEQQELINEGASEGMRARNLGDLKIEGTHYALIQAELDREGIDATGLFI